MGAIRDFWTTGRSVRQTRAVTGSGRILDGAVNEIRANPSCRDVVSTSANGSLHAFILPLPQGRWKKGLDRPLQTFAHTQSEILAAVVAQLGHPPNDCRSQPRAIHGRRWTTTRRTFHPEQRCQADGRFV